MRQGTMLVAFVVFWLLANASAARGEEVRSLAGTRVVREVEVAIEEHHEIQKLICSNDAKNILFASQINSFHYFMAHPNATVRVVNERGDIHHLSLGNQEYVDSLTLSLDGRTVAIWHLKNWGRMRGLGERNISMFDTASGRMTSRVAVQENFDRAITRDWHSFPVMLEKYSSSSISKSWLNGDADMVFRFESNIRSVLITNDEHVVGVDGSGQCGIWDAQGRRVAWCGLGRREGFGILGLCWDNGTPIVLALSGDALLAYNAKSGSKIASRPVPNLVRNLFSVNGLYPTFSEHRGVVCYWHPEKKRVLFFDAATLEPCGQLELDSCMALAFDPEGKHLVSVGEQGTIQVHELEWSR